MILQSHNDITSFHVLSCNGDDIAFIKLLWRLNEILHIKCLGILIMVVIIIRNVKQVLNSSYCYKIFTYVIYI